MNTILAIADELERKGNCLLLQFNDDTVRNLAAQLRAEAKKVEELEVACSSKCESCERTICRAIEFDYRCADCNKLFCLACLREHFVQHTFQNLTKAATEVAISIDHLQGFHKCLQHEMEQRICPKSELAERDALQAKLKVAEAERDGARDAMARALLDGVSFRNQISQIVEHTHPYKQGREIRALLALRTITKH